MKTQLTIAAAVLTLAACTPKFYPPQVATPESYVYGAGFSSDTTGVGERWWELFGDTTLDALVEQALANNRDVAVAAARVQQARANLKTVRAQYLPCRRVCPPGRHERCRCQLRRVHDLSGR